MTNPVLTLNNLKEFGKNKLFFDIWMGLTESLLPEVV